MARLTSTRPIPSAPASFDGDLKDLYTQVLERVLPSLAEVEHQHRELLAYVQQPAPVFVVRNVRGLERGEVYSTNDGSRFISSDNAPAWWMHFVTFNGLHDAAYAQMPTRMFHVRRVLPTSISAAGFHVAHILNVKDRNVDWRHWNRNELQRRFIRNVHPCNCFYVPTTNWHTYGGHSGVITFFADVYSRRYGAVWDEFLRLAGGTAPPPKPAPRYVYPLGPRSPAHERVEGPLPGVTASYRFSRLCFKAAIIEPLAMNDSFEVITPDGVFRMMKGDLYRDFANVVQSKSYRESGIYHYPKIPAAAERYRVT